MGSDPSPEPALLPGLELAGTYCLTSAQMRRRVLFPLLGASTACSRVFATFALDSLVASTEGIEPLYRSGGHARLLFHIEAAPAELFSAGEEPPTPEQVAAHLTARVLNDVSRLGQSAAADRLALLAWMMRDRAAEARIAILESQLEGAVSQQVPTALFSDAEGSTVSAQPTFGQLGSTDEGEALEQVDLHFSWTDAPRLAEHERIFEEKWSGDWPSLRIVPLDASFWEQLIEELGGPSRPYAPETPQALTTRSLLEAARRCSVFAPLNLGPVALYPHQERALLEGLGRWPIRVLLADEVGLGKTLEAGAIIAYAVRHLRVKRVVVLAPASVLRQWQEELAFHFGLPFWRYEGSGVYASAAGDTLAMPRAAPLCEEMPRLAIISAQLARGASRRAGSLFEQADVLPDMVVLDEAHAARVHPRDDGSSDPTLIYRMMDFLRMKVPHLVFLTATPLQTNWQEYHALLALLGLPRIWRSPEDYQTSLRLLSKPPTETVELDDVAQAVGLVRSSRMETGWSPGHLPEAESDAWRLIARASEPAPPDLIGILKAWPTLFSLLVYSHPAHLLTVRSSRGGLRLLGYRFPKRELHAPLVDVDAEVTSFYEAVEDYLREAYGGPELAASAGKVNIALARSLYQQRLASSLRACLLSLQARRQKVVTKFGATLSPQDPRAGDAHWSEVEDEEAETLLHMAGGASEAVSSNIDLACSIEAASLDQLVERLDRIIESIEDPKMAEVLRIIERHVPGDAVLVFSHYTDTLDAALAAFKDAYAGVGTPGHGMYTGQSSWVDTGRGRTALTKHEVRARLDSGENQGAVLLRGSRGRPQPPGRAGDRQRGRAVEPREAGAAHRPDRPAWPACRVGRYLQSVVPGQRRGADLHTPAGAQRALRSGCG